MQQNLATIDCHLQGSSGDQKGMGPGLDVTRGRHTPVCEREVGAWLWYPNVKIRCPALHGGDFWGPVPHLSKIMRLGKRMGGALNQLELLIHVISCKKHFNHFLGYDWVPSGEFISSSRMMHVLHILTWQASQGSAILELQGLHQHVVGRGIDYWWLLQAYDKASSSCSWLWLCHSDSHGTSSIASLNPHILKTDTISISMETIEDRKKKLYQMPDWADL